MRNIADIYLSIARICNNLIDSSIYGSNIQHLMLDFNKEITIVTKEETSMNITKKYVNMFGHSQQFCLGCIYG